MAIPKRHASIPGTYFVTSRTWESRKLFVAESVCQTFVETLVHYREERAYLLHAFVLMPDHFHVLITPSQSVSLEKAVQFIKGGSGRQIGLLLAKTLCTRAEEFRWSSASNTIRIDDPPQGLKPRVEESQVRHG